MNDPKIEEARILRASGMSLSQIADKLGIAKSTAHSWTFDTSADRLVDQSNDFSDDRPAFERDFSGFSRTQPKKHVRVAEPSYVKESRERIFELEKKASLLERRLEENRKREIRSLQETANDLIQEVWDNDGEIWDSDELLNFASELELISKKLQQESPDLQKWVREDVVPIIEMLRDAADDLDEDGLDEGQVFFSED